MSVMVIAMYDAFGRGGAARQAFQATAGDERFDRIEGRIEHGDRRFEQVAARPARGETRPELLTWMVGIMLKLTGGVFSGTLLQLPRAMPTAAG